MPIMWNITNLHVFYVGIILNREDQKTCFISMGIVYLTYISFYVDEVILSSVYLFSQTAR